MNLDNKFSALELALINDQAALYSCACPMHVSMQITNLRKLFDYQNECIALDSSTENPVDVQVHLKIAEATKQAHQHMEQCLDEILTMEGWDRTKMAMPVDYRKRK